MTDHVDPNLIPYVNAVDGGSVVDLTSVRSAVTKMNSIAATVRTSGQDVVDAWAKISACYSGPGDVTVWSAMAPVGPDTDTLAGGFETVASAVKAFADEVAPIITALQGLKARAELLVYDIKHFTPYVRHDWGAMLSHEALASGVVGEAWRAVVTAAGTDINEWDQDPDLVKRNNDLVKDINHQVVLYEDAERTCANKIDALFGGTQWHAWGATDKMADTDSSYGYDENALGQMDTPWGQTVDRSESCQEWTTMFVPNFLGGLEMGAEDMVIGLGSLLLGLYGYSVEQGTLLPGEYGFSVGGYKITSSWQYAAQTWEGLLDLVAGLGTGLLPGTGFLPIPSYNFTTGTWSSTTGYQTTLNVLKSMISWDEFGKDPGTALGKAVFNIGMFFIPGGEATSGLDAAKGAGETLDAAKFGEDAADAGKGADEALDAGKGAEAADAARGLDQTAKGMGDATKGIDDATHFDTPKFDDNLPASDHFTTNDHPPVNDHPGTNDQLINNEHPNTVEHPGDTPHEPTTSADHPGDTPAHDPGSSTENPTTPSHTDDATMSPTDPGHPGGDAPATHDPVDWQPDETAAQKGDTKWASDPTDPIPDNLATDAADQKVAVDSARQASNNLTSETADMNNAIDHYNTEHPDIPIPHVQPADLNAKNLKTTIQQLGDEVGDDDPALLDELARLQQTADARAAALRTQTITGEKFGEDAGTHAASLEGDTPVITSSSPGKGTLDQVWLNQDSSTLIIQECKGPSADLGTRQVLSRDGSKVSAEQGSTAYLWQELRVDTRLTDAVNADPALRQGLLDGSIKIDYRMVQPDKAGHVRITDFNIDQSALDIPGWLG